MLINKSLRIFSLAQSLHYVPGLDMMSAVSGRARELSPVAAAGQLGAAAAAT